MKILYVHQHFSTPSGSSGTRPYENAKVFANEGNEVVILCGSYQNGVTGLTGIFRFRQRSGYVDGIKIIELNYSYSNKQNIFIRSVQFLLFALHSIFITCRVDFDVIYASSTPLSTGIPGIFARWILKKPFVFEVRDLWPELPKALKVLKNPLLIFMLDLLESAIYKSASKIIGLSPGIVDGVISKGIDPTNIFLVPNGCDLGLFNEEKSWLPNGICSQDLICIFSGTHGIANGLDFLVDVGHHLKLKRISNIKILLVGDGSQKQRLKKRAEKYGLDSLIFISPISKNKLAELFVSCDIGLQILKNVPEFYYGTSPNKFFDYISAGLPVITNYPGWVADLIIANDCGFVTEPNQPEKFCELLILLNKSELLKKSKNARTLAKNKFDRRKLAIKSLDVISKSLDGEVD